jgi:hypothetical protein
LGEEEGVKEPTEMYDHELVEAIGVATAGTQDPDGDSVRWMQRLEELQRACVIRARCRGILPRGGSGQRPENPAPKPYPPGTRYGLLRRENLEDRR